MSNQTRSEKRIKQDAKLIKKKTGCSHSEALDIASQDAGFTNYPAYKKSLKQSTNCLTEQEIRKELAKRSIDYAIFIPTETGLKKAILDATAPMRSLFQNEDFHNYSNQKQEPGHKVTTQAFFIAPNEILKTVASLYRPNTKKGDPRMWFKGLKSFSSPNNPIAIVFYEKTPYLLNLSIKYTTPFLLSFLDSITKQQSIANELLTKLKEIANNPISSTVKGSTAVGMAVEAALGISPNSNKKPDYKGIELKSTRSRTNTRKGLFTQVAKWNISKVTSSKQLLETYGYDTENGRKLNCTVSTLKPNPQGLMLGIDSNYTELHEIHTDNGSILIWPLSLLVDRLLEKHSETFWIEADSEIIDNKEIFRLKSIIHTKSPLVSQLVPLIEEGAITLDHMIKINSKGSAEERGPAFKLKPSHLSLLFPSPVKYDLIDK